MNCETAQKLVKLCDLAMHAYEIFINSNFSDETDFGNFEVITRVMESKHWELCGVCPPEYESLSRRCCFTLNKCGRRDSQSAKWRLRGRYDGTISCIWFGGECYISKAGSRS